MTCDCPDPIVFGHHHHDGKLRDTIRGHLRPGEHIIPASGYTAEAMRRLTGAMRALVQIPPAS